MRNNSSCTVSDHFDGKRFFDPTIADRPTLTSFIKWHLMGKKSIWPKRVEVTQYDVPPKKVDGENIRISNIGHVTFLIQTQGLNILTDPIWSARASPLPFIGPKRVIDPGIKFEDLPPIDLIWISHNHYDHLDIKTIKKLWKSHKPRIITPLGNDTIIHSYDKNIVVEAYDWEDEVHINQNMTFHLSPMQHWSARGVLDYNKALWAALTIKTTGGNIYFIGDSGYGDGRYFKQAKEQFGNFRLALLPMGAYEPRWLVEYAHMNPDEMVKAHIDLGMPFTIPSHYDVFKLAEESYGDALLRLNNAITEYDQINKIKALKIGEFWEIPH